MSVPPPAEPRRRIQALLTIMAQLRDPRAGCPWDLKQDFASIGAYTLEEAYEVVDAIDRGDMDDLRDELGDLLLQVVFHSRMAEERGAFGFADVVQAISDKMVRRHPHVFGDARFADAEAQTRAWEAIKADERRRGGDTDTSALAGIARGLPEHRRAAKLQKRAAATGFDWPSPGPVLDKAAEELEEVRAEFVSGNREALEEEIGDLLFVVVNLCRHGGVDFAAALRRANGKFERRFRAMETHAAKAGHRLDDYDLAVQEALWRRVKREQGHEGTDSADRD